MPRVTSGQCELCDGYCDRLYTVRIKDGGFTVLVCAECKEHLEAEQKED